jgi:UDP-N-acetylmuramoyl-L-alanine---L-glutamate ligase
MKKILAKYVENRQVLILGFGREGRSTYRLLKEFFPAIKPVIADRNPILNVDEFMEITPDQLLLGENYLDAIKTPPDVVFKSPGVQLTGRDIDVRRTKIISQTSVFLEKYRRQIIGVTGTKGKSTTASLIFHLLKTAGLDAALVGNIGVPPFEAVGRISEKTCIVFEMSAHQLEFVSHSPHIAILLNIYQEHLDHFGTFDYYAETKLNIARFQNNDDHLIFDADQMKINRFQPNIFLNGNHIPIVLSEDFYDSEKMLLKIPKADAPLSVKKISLKGRHNLKNILAAAAACFLSGVSTTAIGQGLNCFKPLEHRLEEVGSVCGIIFINDSISTIPEATIAAVKTFAQTDTLILGGHDRNIDYTALIDFLLSSNINNFIFTGAAGKRMMAIMQKKQPVNKRLIFVDDWNEMSGIILQYTGKGKICLLSPAASSYDRFTNFEERGKFFKHIVENLKNFKEGDKNL